MDLLISANIKGLKFYGLAEEIRSVLHKKVDILDINQLKDNIELTEYFDVVMEKTKFKKWFFGHYHDNRQIMREYVMLYEQIIRIA